MVRTATDLQLQSYKAKTKQVHVKSWDRDILIEQSLGEKKGA